MKQLLAMTFALALVFSLSACGRRREEPVTVPTTAPTTMATTPTIAATTHETEPTMSTNIPDPSVDTGMPDMTEVLPTQESMDSDTTAHTEQGANP